MAWCRQAMDHLAEPMLTQFCDKFSDHTGSSLDSQGLREININQTNSMKLRPTLYCVFTECSYPWLRAMGFLQDTQNCGLRMHRECRECFPRH